MKEYNERNCFFRFEMWDKVWHWWLSHWEDVLHLFNSIHHLLQYPKWHPCLNAQGYWNVVFEGDSSALQLCGTGGGLVTKLCLTLATPWTSLPGSFIHGISQTRILEWVAISFSRALPHPRMEPASPTLTASRFFTTEPLEKPFSQCSRIPMYTEKLILNSRYYELSIEHYILLSLLRDHLSMLISLVLGSF